MLNNTVCQLARLMTNTKNSDAQINTEYNKLSNSDKISAAKQLDDFMKKNNQPFDKAYATVGDDYSAISNQFEICPATLFCVYMEVKNSEELV